MTVQVESSQSNNVFLLFACFHYECVPNQTSRFLNISPLKMVEANGRRMRVTFTAFIFLFSHDRFKVRMGGAFS